MTKTLDKKTLVPVFEGTKVPREAPPPSKWGRSRTGTALFVVRKVGYRNHRGQKLYRLGYKVSDERGPLFSQQLWTLDELTKSGVVWLKESPFTTDTDAVELDRMEMPKDVVEDVDEPEQVVEPPKRRHSPELMQAPTPAPAAKPAPQQPQTLEGRYGLKVGQTAYHIESGKPYLITGVVDMDTARVEEVATDGVKRPSRNMRATKLQHKPKS